MVQTGEIEAIGFIQGNTFSKTLKMQTKDENDALQPFDLSAMTDILMDFRDKPNQEGNLIARIGLNDGIVISGDDNEYMTISLTKEQTNAFPFNTEPFSVTWKSITGTAVNTTANGKYYADIAFFVGEEVKTLLKTTVVVIASITEIP